jgi:hypothetical protein
MEVWKNNMNEQEFAIELRKQDFTENRINEILELYKMMKGQNNDYTLEEHLKGVLEVKEKNKNRPDDVVSVDG